MCHGTWDRDTCENGKLTPGAILAMSVLQFIYFTNIKGMILMM